MASVNCFGDDRYEDVQLFYCQLPANESICELLQQMYDVKEARALLVAIPLTLSFLAAILNGSFGAMTILFCARNKYPVDHQHALLLSETLSVLVAQALFYSTLLAIKFNYEFGYTFVALCLCVASMDRDRVLWESSVRAMKRLTLQVIAFTLSGAPILAVSSFTLAHLDQIELLGLENASPCAFIVKGKLIGQAERLVCINVSAWILPMISVPLISCYVDSNIHELIRHKFGLRSATTLVDHQSKLTK
ncbi:hypothetical protein Tcan_03109 [Toxocara canis]|uniref:G_PROTEIN_RECEP_F1_2 domain-containing protein n=1 Tax=Toxocara canis TaxID=6265 RepID=A0A0B2UXY7_TOXCA|nr:hypothetical protein Tcan_03109 [Toxocara canis]